MVITRDVTSKLPHEDRVALRDFANRRFERATEQHAKDFWSSVLMMSLTEGEFATWCAYLPHPDAEPGR